MIIPALLRVFSCFLSFISLFAIWYGLNGFDPLNWEWWIYLYDHLSLYNRLPDYYLVSLIICVTWFTLTLVIYQLYIQRGRTKTISGKRNTKNLHGTARLATFKDIKKRKLLRQKTGVVLGAVKKGFFSRLKPIIVRDFSHILVIAQSEAGKGISLVLPTLLRYPDSIICLDIKGENFDLTAGYRQQKLGQRILKFNPSRPDEGHRFNFLAEIDLESDACIKQVQRLTDILLSDGKNAGQGKYFYDAAKETLTGLILHILFYAHHEHGQRASMGNIYTLQNILKDEAALKEIENYKHVIRMSDPEKTSFGSIIHRPDIDQVVAKMAEEMKKMAASQKSGVLGTISVALSLWADPLLRRATDVSDFRLDELQNDTKPVSLYLTFPSSDHSRLGPIYQLFYEQLVNHYVDKAVGKSKRDLLLLNDEFTAIGKLKSFDKQIAYIRGWGIKAMMIIQDMDQLYETYGEKNSILSNCKFLVAFGNSNPNTTKLLSNKAGESTTTERSFNASHTSNSQKGSNSVSENITAHKTNVLTPEEVSTLKPVTIKNKKATKPGKLLIFETGQYPIMGWQYLFFKDRHMRKSSQIPAPSVKELHQYKSHVQPPFNANLYALSTSDPQTDTQATADGGPHQNPFVSPPESSPQPPSEPLFGKAPPSTSTAQSFDVTKGMISYKAAREMVTQTEDQQATSSREEKSLLPDF